MYRVESSKIVCTISKCFKTIKKRLIWNFAVCSAVLQQIFEFSRQKWLHQKCESTNRFAHPSALICDSNHENVLKTLPWTDRVTWPGTPCKDPFLLIQGVRARVSLPQCCVIEIKLSNILCFVAVRNTVLVSWQLSHFLSSWPKHSGNLNQ